MQDPFGSIAPVLATVTIGFVYFINITSIYCIYFTNAVIFGYYILSLAMDVTNESAIKTFSIHSLRLFLVLIHCLQN